MRLYTRVLLTAGCIEYGSFATLSTLGHLIHPLFYGLAGAWLALSRRPVRRFLVAPLFDCRVVPAVSTSCALRAAATCRRPASADVSTSVFAPAEYTAYAG